MTRQKTCYYLTYEFEKNIQQMKIIVLENTIFDPKPYTRKPHIIWSIGIYFAFLVSNLGILSYGIHQFPDGYLTLWNSGSPLFDLLIIWTVSLHLIIFARLCTRISYPYFRKMDSGWLLLNMISTTLTCLAVVVITST